ncbi:hypothetical protein [Segatella copri]|uniref:hypothetical protein n=1 Tax=Segatella copri TaxID=165179 RepID=UPI001183675D|nr:hypothetical protein [Segatella copri]
MIIICIIKKLSHNTQHHLPDIVTFFSEPSPSPTKNKNLDYKILYKTFLLFFLHDSDNNRKFAADKLRKLMKEKRYTLPEEQKDAAFAAEPAVNASRIKELHNSLVNRVMTIQNPEILQSLIVYVDQNILNKPDSFEEEWKRSISIEEFRQRCKSKLKEKYE